MCDWYETQRVDDVNLDHDGDMLLFQWGTYSWNGDAFSYDITRQFIVESAEDDDAIWQLALTVLFDAADETESLGSGGQWCYRPDQVDDFRSFVAASPVTAFALSRRPVGARWRFEQAGSPRQNCRSVRDTAVVVGQAAAMPSAQEIADFAIAAASAALDQVVAFIGTDAPYPPDDDGDDPASLLTRSEHHPFDRRSWVVQSAFSLVIGARFVLNPVDLDVDDDDRTDPDVEMSKPIWEIKLIIESDDVAQVDRIADEVSRVACPTLPADMTADHECDIPWLVVSTPLDDDQADAWRNDLNR
jgi:hypothetical protein